MITAPLNQVKDSLSDFVNRACRDDVLVTRHGRPAAIIIGFADEDDWIDYRLEHDERFIQRMAESRAQAASGHWRTLDDIEADLRLTSSRQTTQGRTSARNTSKSNVRPRQNKRQKGAHPKT